MSKQSTPQTIYQIKVTLTDSKPPIWRRLQINSNLGLNKLHAVLQIVMGWENCHLHQFIKDDTYYSDPESGLERTLNENRVRLDTLLQNEKDRLYYEYDFGDGWTHEVVLEKILPAEEGIQYPLCIDGKRACPPEDCGGIWGYENTLEILKDPTHPEYADWNEWMPANFDANYFDINSVNKRLKSLYKS